MPERQELPQPRAILHIGEDSTPWPISREEMPDEELQIVAKEVPMLFTDFFRRTHNDPNLNVSVEILEASTTKPTSS